MTEPQAAPSQGGVRRAVFEVAIVCTLWVAAFAAGGSYMRLFSRQGGVGDFGQREFGAAVALACGRGFVNYGYDATPAYTRFLARQRDTLSCGDLPAGPAPYALNFTQRLYPYLMSSASLVWWVRGVSWSGLWPLFGAMFASVVVLAYGLFRVAIGRVLSADAATALIVSAIHLGHLPLLRDYAKAPFMLALVLLIVRMAITPVEMRRTIGLGASFGGVLGVGFGFRNDVLIHVPVFLAVVAFCLPGPLLSNIKIKLAAIAAAAVVFVITAWPVMRAYSGGSNTGHTALLGLMTPYDRTLGIRPSIYDWGYKYVDQYAADMITSYGQRVDSRPVEYLSKDYEREAMSYLVDIARNWPADMLTRVYASVVRVLQMPFTVGVWASSVPFGVTGGWAASIYTWQTWLLSRYLEGSGLLVTVAALVVLSARSVWNAAALLAFILYYTGYPAIQFGARHFFHLELIGWGALAFLLQQVVNAAVATVRGDGSRTTFAADGRRPRNALAFAGVASIVLAGSVAVLRAYQSPHVDSLLQRYLDAPRERLSSNIVDTAEQHRVMVVSPGLWQSHAGDSKTPGVRTRYVVADFATSSTCDALRLPVTFSYRYTDKTSDFSRDDIVSLAPAGAPTRIYFPAYSDRDWSSDSGPSPTSFEGIQIRRGFEGCLAGLYRIVDLARTPLLIDVTFTPDWQSANRFQTIASLERDPGGPTAYYAAPWDLVVTRRTLAEARDLDGNAPTYQSAIVSRTGAGWTAKGRADGPETALLRFPPIEVTAGAQLVVQGELATGGVSVDLFAAGRGAASAVITRNGPFVAVLEAPSSGPIEVVLSNAIAPWWPASQIGHRVGPLVAWIPGATLRTDVTLTRIGWAPPAAPGS